MNTQNRLRQSEDILEWDQQGGIKTVEEVGWCTMGEIAERMVSVDPEEERLGGTYKNIMQETRKDRVKLYSCADGKRDKADTIWNIA